jgi:hypothetical protein
MDSTKKHPALSLAAASGELDGEINLLWEPVRGARTYVIQFSRDSANPSRWVQEDIVSKSRCTVSKLRSGKKYWFRVAAIGPKGQGPWSEPVQKKAP